MATKFMSVVSARGKRDRETVQCNMAALQARAGAGALAWQLGSRLVRSGITRSARKGGRAAWLCGATGLPQAGPTQPPCKCSIGATRLRAPAAP